MCSTLPIAPQPEEPGHARWVPCGRSTRFLRLPPDAGSLFMDVGSNLACGARTGSSTKPLYRQLTAGEAPADRLHAVEAEPSRERRRQIELAVGARGPAFDDLGEHALAVKGEIELRPAREHRMRDPERPGLEESAGRDTR